MLLERYAMRNKVRSTEHQAKRRGEARKEYGSRKHSLLFGGAYAPNDAIYRKRYAFTDALIKLLIFFGRFT